MFMFILFSKYTTIFIYIYRFSEKKLLDVILKYYWLPLDTISLILDYSLGKYDERGNFF